MYRKIGLSIIAILFVALAALGLSRRASAPELDLGLKKETSLNGSLESYFNLAQNLGTKDQPTELSFLAVGDIMLSRNVAGKISKSNNPNLPFTKMEDLLKSVDFNFGNLESPISGRNDFNPTGSLVFNAPPAYAQSLSTYNFKVLNLANNHALDQGEAGLVYTRNFLNNLGITHLGTGKNLDEAWTPKIITVQGQKIAFLGASYASTNDGGRNKNNFVARIEDLDRLKQSIESIKNQSDFIVITMHAGTEYVRNPNQNQIDFAKAAIDAGADLVIGAHPHWIQTIENYKGKYIFYSLGNFIFDQEWSQDTKEGLAIKITLTNNSSNNPLPNQASGSDIQGNRTKATLKQIELIPIIIENYSTPRPATEEETNKILKKINQLNTTLFP